MHFWMLDFSGAQEIPFSWMFSSLVTIDDELLRLAAIRGNGRNEAKNNQETQLQIKWFWSQITRNFFYSNSQFHLRMIQQCFLPFSVSRRGCNWITIPYPVAFPKTWGICQSSFFWTFRTTASKVRFFPSRKGSNGAQVIGFSPGFTRPRGEWWSEIWIRKFSTFKK